MAGPEKELATDQRLARAVDEEEVQTYLDALSLKSQFRDEKQLAEALVRVVSKAARIVEEDRDAPDPPPRHVNLPVFRLSGWHDIDEWDADLIDYAINDLEWIPTRVLLPSPITEPLAPFEGRFAEPMLLGPLHEASTATPARAATGEPPSEAAPEAAPVVLRRGVTVSLLTVLLSTALLLESVAWGLAGMYIGFAGFCFANFVAAQVREPNVILQPATALLGCVASLGLAVMAVVGAL